MIQIKPYTLALLITASLLLGVGFMGVLSMKASKIYIETFRIKYLNEQEELALRAQKDADFNRALVHYSNLVYATSPPGIHFFQSMQSQWSLSFPFAAAILQIGQDIAASETGRRGLEGINRGKLGLILEALGRKAEAEEQYQIAGKLMGINDIKFVKDKVRDIHEKNMQNWLQLGK